MFRFQLGFFLIVPLVLGSCTEDPQKITVLSWNVQNLFDARFDGHEYPEFNPKLGKWTVAAYQSRLKDISKTILASKNSGPDLIVLLEIEGKSVVDDLATTWLSNKGYRDWLFVGPKSGGIGIAIISKLKISDAKALGVFYKDQELRPIAQVNLMLGRLPLHLYAVHFKSMRDGESKTRGQRNLGNEILINAMYADKTLSIAVGDFNSPYLVQLPLNSQEIVPSNQDQVGGTYFINKSWQSLDHLIAEKGLSCEARILTEPQLLNSSGQPRRFFPNLVSGMSDHLPLLGTLELSTNHH